MRGSFTGATHDHGGLFQAADGGTLFLDEIGDLSLATQAKVLRALENGEILRAGSTQITRVDARIVAATHRPLAVIVSNGTFRPDLFFRLKVVQLVVPPLRERREDLEQLVQHFLTLNSHARPVPLELDDDVMRVFREYDWPGNVRELRNMISGAVVMADDDRPLQAQDFSIPLNNSGNLAHGAGGSMDSAEISDDQSHIPFAEARARALAEFDRTFLTAALARHSGNIARTARSLGLHRQSLQKLMARRGIKSGRATN